jgi:hypothetical protein
MSRRMDKKRARQVLVMAVVAISVLVAALAMATYRVSQTWTPAVEGPVCANWSQTVEVATQIEIWSNEDHFVLDRVSQAWVMPSRDNHAIRPERLAELDNFLELLSYEGPRTADPAKHSRLGLAAHGEDGAGLHITIRDETGNSLADIILGEVRAGRIYFRFPEESRTFAANITESGAVMPNVSQADQWLDLDFVALGRSEIARADIAPETGPAYRLERPARTARNFALRQPSGWTPITAGAGNGPGAALSRLRFRDVRRADRLRGERVARHVAETFGGLQLALDVIAQGETRWVTIQARALTDGSEDIANALNARVDGWAYLLSDLSADRLLRPLDEIADARETDIAP